MSSCNRWTLSEGANSDNESMFLAVAMTLSPRARIAEMNNLPKPELQPVISQTRDEVFWSRVIAKEKNDAVQHCRLGGQQHMMSIRL